jgi:hypothetical protein
MRVWSWLPQPAETGEDLLLMGFAQLPRVASGGLLDRELAIALDLRAGKSP